MNLDQYLEAIRTCPDEMVERPVGKYTVKIPGEKNLQHRLTTELGVYDNYPILLKRDIEQVKHDLVERRYLLQPPVIFESKALAEVFAGITIYEFDCPDETVCFSIETPCGDRPDYSTTIVLHPNHKIIGIRPKDIAKVILDLGEYIKKEKIPACFPRSGGWNHPRDRSKIVYYKPK